MQSLDNACFAWSMVVALHSAQSNTNRELSYPHYTTVLNLKDIQFPITLSQIKKIWKFLNDISINVYGSEKQKEMTILSLRLTDIKRDKHVNLLYVQNPQNNNAEHFV